MFINMPTVVYRKLLEKLEARVWDIVKDLNKFQGVSFSTVRRNVLWKEFYEKTEKDPVLTAGGHGLRPGNNYFLRRVKLSLPDDTITTFHHGAFAGALNFIYGYIPVNESYDTELKAREWGKAFLDEYFSARPDYFDILFRTPQAGKSGTPIDQVQGLRGKLNNSIFIAECKQGLLTDRVVFKMSVSSDNIVSGTFEVLYQEENFDYKDEVVVLDIRGNLFADTLSLSFQNRKSMHHNGVYLGKVPPFADSIFGRYIVHYPKRPAVRESDISVIDFIRCEGPDADKVAQLFLERWFNKKADKQLVKELVEKWKAIRELEMEAAGFLGEFRKGDKFTGPVKNFIKACRMEQAENIM